MNLRKFALRMRYNSFNYLFLSVVETEKILKRECFQKEIGTIEIEVGEDRRVWLF
jgi:hypothetical protein